ncbi:PEP-CTERM sorting domain-containing protein [Duganella dendranthematis]|uniref:PEP-CTERM sorting domain-containing protein n=1 Tax=Duganella dendranthematis TaxID=2728021 RepID=A0ABX6MAZ4_9BURK|nr:PEP-CTERM sorting domain-containing protein [Duganella dendranthematis]QJD91400.1 PEP-CTERM sorting domain-containing protein [Duganella dendranthematis]
MGLVVADPSATALTYNHIPDSLTPFPQGTFRYYYSTGMAPHALWLTAAGAITSVTLVSSVPEPATYTMMAAGLGLLAWRRQRQIGVIASSSA